MRRVGVVGLALCALVVASPGRAAALQLAEFRGHLAVGYGHLFLEDAPGGSLSVAGGVDYPLTKTLRLGVDVGYHLLGSRTVQEGSLLADVDYSLFETTALVHWTPSWPGPVGRISAGAGLFNAQASLATSGGGASFTKFAVEETVPGFAVSATLLSRKPSALKLGLEVGGRIALVEDESWSTAIARVAVHY